MIEYLREFNSITVIVRLILACICGSLLGLNREKQGRAAGLRTYYIVCLGACSAMLLSQYLNMMLNSQWADTAALVGIKTDVSRFAAQVVNGIGFLGAGSILLTRKNQVRGLTSAASLWACATLGIAIGAGFVELAVIAFVFMFITLKLLAIVDIKTDNRLNKTRFGIEMTDLNKVPKIIDFIKKESIELIDYNYSNEQDDAYLEVKVHLPRFYSVIDFISHIYAFDFVKAVKKL